MDRLEKKVKEIEGKLKIWAEKIDEFTAEAQKSNGWARIELRQSIDDLKVKRALFQAKIDEFEAAESHSRDALKIRIESAWKDFEDACEKMGLLRR